MIAYSDCWSGDRPSASRGFSALVNSRATPARWRWSSGARWLSWRWSLAMTSSWVLRVPIIHPCWSELRTRLSARTGHQVPEQAGHPVRRDRPPRRGHRGKAGDPGPEPPPCTREPAQRLRTRCRYARGQSRPGPRRQAYRTDDGSRPPLSPALQRRPSRTPAPPARTAAGTGQMHPQPHPPRSKTRPPPAAGTTHRQPRRNAIARPTTDPNYTNWPRPILELV